MNIYYFALNINIQMKKQLFGRYITYPMIAPLLDKYPFEEVISLGTSVKGTPINLYRVGKGHKKDTYVVANAR